MANSILEWMTNGREGPFCEMHTNAILKKKMSAAVPNERHGGLPCSSSSSPGQHAGMVQKPLAVQRRPWLEKVQVCLRGLFAAAALVPGSNTAAAAARPTGHSITNRTARDNPATTGPRQAGVWGPLRGGNQAPGASNQAFYAFFFCFYFF